MPKGGNLSCNDKTHDFADGQKHPILQKPGAKSDRVPFSIRRTHHQKQDLDICICNINLVFHFHLLCNQGTCTSLPLGPTISIQHNATNISVHCESKNQTEQEQALKMDSSALVLPVDPPLHLPLGWSPPSAAPHNSAPANPRGNQGQSTYDD